MNALKAAIQPGGAAQPIGRQWVICLEGIRPGASVCPHCRTNLAPLQALADRDTALEERVTAPRQWLQKTRLLCACGPTSPSPHTEIKWSHMIENIFRRLVSLLVPRWFATVLPGSSPVVFRLVRPVVASPFGLRSQQNLPGGATVQVIAALAFGSIGTLLNSVLDVAEFGQTPPGLTTLEIVASIAAIALSHYAASALADVRLRFDNHPRRVPAHIPDSATLKGALSAKTPHPVSRIVGSDHHTSGFSRPSSSCDLSYALAAQ